ncbi:DegT/DnrJ/EryC1/StrS family aminotransferase [Salinimicrobium sp. TIG7-5_MAKvit]|uniref:DegT/DnrJ/EryC1/StrS family aminotransferase n=1 Tax=Salinimicrobium sp. TIG7-5_MAKvit TaxID=3121289 RepID=UPI003C6E935B
MIPVTKTFLPPQEEYQAVLSRAWDAGWITNRGELVKELEEKLKSYLEVPNIIATTNGTLPLQIAIKALGLTGEIITTPFSYVATTSSIVWENCKPVFVDIHPDYFTIDESRIEAAITESTSGILATHVFGNPCNVEAIEKIANKHNLKVIYDGAHSFGVTYKGSSIFNFGDVSTCSFHATKIFHSGEGGAIFCSDPNLFQKLYFHHNFGHDGPDKFKGIGINAKMSELQAALGLTVFAYIESLLNGRKKVFQYYNEHLFKEKRLRLLKIRYGAKLNYSYFPIIFENEEVCLKVKLRLEYNEIFPRRYFYPSLNLMEYAVGGSCPIAESYSSQILCLPVYQDLSVESQEIIIAIIKEVLNE